MGKKEKVLYVVEASSGQYEDHRTRPLAIFDTLRAAEQFATAATERLAVMSERYKRLTEKYFDDEQIDESLWDRAQRVMRSSKFDPELDDLETTYHAYALPFHTEASKKAEAPTP